MRLVRLLPLVVGVLAFAPVTHAAVWTAPQQIAGDQARTPFAAVAPSGGGAVVAWLTGGSGSNGFLGFPDGVSYSSRAATGAPFAAPHALDGFVSAAGLTASGGRGRILFSGSSSLLETSGPLGGEFGTPVTRMDEPATAYTDREGDVLALFDRQQQTYAALS